MAGPVRRARVIPVLAMALSLSLLYPAGPTLAASSAQPTGKKTGPAAGAAEWNLLTDGVTVLFRHAEAPGSGDPGPVRFSDCATQRNLDENGRDQARRIGEEFRGHGIVVGRVLSSQWCRTQDTAELAFPGQRQDEPLFNSFFRDPKARTTQIDGARDLIRRWTGPGVLVVVTHQVNITALTDLAPASGEGIIVRAASGGGIHDAKHGLEVIGRIRP